MNVIEGDGFIIRHAGVARARANRKDVFGNKICASRIKKTKLDMNVVTLEYRGSEFVSEGKSHGPASSHGGAERKRRAAPIGVVFFSSDTVAQDKSEAASGRVVEINRCGARAVGAIEPLRAVASRAGVFGAEKDLTAGGCVRDGLN